MTTSTSGTTGPWRAIETHPTGGETTLYLVRHGRTSGNVLRQFIGSTDLPLDPFGIRQAERIADRLAKEVKADAIVSSPLVRARATAEAIGQRLGLTPAIEPGLAEMNFGDLEGLTFETVAEKYPDLAVRALEASEEDLIWPNGESSLAFHQRVFDAFGRILHEYSSHAVIVVAHGGVLGSFLAQVEGKSPNDWRAYQLGNCGLSHVDFRAQHTVVHFMNDCGHLDALVETDDELVAP